MKCKTGHVENKKYFPRVIRNDLIAEFENTKIFELEVYAPLIAKSYLPGQFVILMVNEKSERIPLTIVKTDIEQSTITIIYQVLGYSTNLLSKIKPKENLYYIVGPLGKPANLKGYSKVVLVGGGVGSAELYPLAVELKKLKSYVTTILGARNKNLLILDKEFKSVSDEVYITTDDGSFGKKGFVSDVLKEILNIRKHDLVYAVGPLIMMKVVSDITKLYNIHTIVSLNTVMVDGTGMCGSCRITSSGKIKYVCVDGPEFDAHSIDWQEIINRNNAYLQQEKEILKLCK